MKHKLTEHRRRSQQKAHGPHTEHHAANMFTASCETVVQAGDRPVAVDSDDKHMKERGIDADLIDHHPQIT